MQITSNITLLFLLISVPLYSCDFLCIMYGNNTSVLTSISNDGSSVSPLGTASKIMDPDSFTSQYYISASIFYVLYSGKYLFSYNFGTQSNQTILLQISQGSLTTFCVSQQFGTLYSLLVESNTVKFVRNIDQGSLQPAAQPYILQNPSTDLQFQCIVDDAYSRILWTFQSNSGFSIVSTDILPQYNGNSRIIYDNPSVLQAWLLADYMNELFYAVTVEKGSLYLSHLYISFEAVKWVDIGPLPVDATLPQGVIGPHGLYVAVMSPAGSIDVFNINNVTDTTEIKVAWGDMDSMSVNSMSLTWIAGSVN